MNEDIFAFPQCLSCAQPFQLKNYSLNLKPLRTPARKIIVVVYNPAVIANKVKVLVHLFPMSWRKGGKEALLSLIKTCWNEGLPEIINLPSLTLFCFKSGQAFSTHSPDGIQEFRPKTHILPSGERLWKFPGHPLYLCSAGVDTKRGELYYENTCVPRAIWGSLGGTLSYDEVAAKAQKAGSLQGADPEKLFNFIKSEFPEFFRYERRKWLINEKDPHIYKDELEQKLEHVRESFEMAKNFSLGGLLAVVFLKKHGHLIGYLRGFEISEGLSLYTPETVSSVHIIARRIK